MTVLKGCENNGEAKNAKPQGYTYIKIKCYIMVEQEIFPNISLSISRFIVLEIPKIVLRIKITF